MNWKDVALDDFLNGSRKLLPCQEERIMEIRAHTGWSYAKIAFRFFGDKVSRQTIYLVCNPRKRKQALEVSKNLKRTRKYYRSADNNVMVKNTRAKKNEIYSLFIKTQKPNG